MVVEVCIHEPAHPESDWRVKLSIPQDTPNPEVQFQEFKTRWDELRAGVPLDLTKGFTGRENSKI
eukprot:9849527-Prorocentrum_lima.AAC.1